MGKDNCPQHGMTHQDAYPQATGGWPFGGLVWPEAVYQLEGCWRCGFVPLQERTVEDWRSELGERSSFELAYLSVSTQ